MLRNHVVSTQKLLTMAFSSGSCSQIKNMAANILFSNKKSEKTRQIVEVLASDSDDGEDSFSSDAIKPLKLSFASENDSLTQLDSGRKAIFKLESSFGVGTPVSDFVTSDFEVSISDKHSFTSATPKVSTYLLTCYIFLTKITKLTH